MVDKQKTFKHMKTDELIELQEEIEERKTQKAQLEGEQNAILKQLKEEWGCKTIKQAQALIEEKELEMNRLEGEIENQLNELETALKLIG